MKYKVGMIGDLISKKNTGSNTEVKVKKKKLKSDKPNVISKVTEEFIKLNDKEAVDIGEPLAYVKKLKRKPKTKHIATEDSGNTSIDDNEAIPSKIQKLDNDDKTDLNDDKLELNDDKSELNDDKLELSTLNKKRLHNAEKRIKGKEKKLKMETRELHVDRTIFVGNVSIDVKKKALLKHFAKYGTIETVRFRSMAVADLRAPKKVAAIKKEFHSDRKTQNAYIRFENPEDAIMALAENGKVFQGTHIRVNLTDARPEGKNAIFVGNLSFKAEDDDLWTLFEPCGSIESVRIVRDKRTGIGKGFGYVNFKTSDSVELALQMGTVSMNERTLRVSICNNDEAKKIKKKKNSANKQENISKFKKTAVSTGRGFQGAKFVDKKKKKKFTNTKNKHIAGKLTKKPKKMKTNNARSVPTEKSST